MHAAYSPAQDRLAYTHSSQLMGVKWTLVSPTNEVGILREESRAMDHLSLCALRRTLQKVHLVEARKPKTFSTPQKSPAAADLT